MLGNARKVFITGHLGKSLQAVLKTKYLSASHNALSSSSLAAEHVFILYKMKRQHHRECSSSRYWGLLIHLTASSAQALTFFMEASLLAETLGTFLSLKFVFLAICEQTGFNKLISDSSTYRNGLSLFL